MAAVPSLPEWAVGYADTWLESDGEVEEGATSHGSAPGSSLPKLVAVDYTPGCALMTLPELSNMQLGLKAPEWRPSGLTLALQFFDSCKWWRTKPRYFQA